MGWGARRVAQCLASQGSDFNPGDTSEAGIALLWSCTSQTFHVMLFLPLFSAFSAISIISVTGGSFTFAILDFSFRWVSGQPPTVFTYLLHIKWIQALERVLNASWGWG